MELIEKSAATGIGEGLEDVIHYTTKWLHISFAQANPALVQRKSCCLFDAARGNRSGLLQVKRARPEVDDPVMPIKNLGTQQANRRGRKLQCLMQDTAQIYYPNFLAHHVARADRQFPDFGDIEAFFLKVDRR